MACLNGSSIDVIDENAFDNALEDLKTIENAANSDDLETLSRLNGNVRTLQGRLQQIAGHIALNGGVWATGISFNGYDEYMIENGTAYKVIPGTPLPVVSTATPDLLSFEPFTVSTSKVEIFEAVDEYNATELGDYTDYVFLTVDDMTNGIVIGGDTVTFKLNQALKVNGESGEISCFIVTDSLPGITLGVTGFYAREVFAKLSDSAAGVNNPIAALDPNNDARNFPKAAMSFIPCAQADLAYGYGAGVLSQQNKIYAVPNQNGDVLKYDVSAKSFSVFGSVATGQGYTSGALASNGNIYAASTGGTQILEIDTVNDNAVEYSGLNVANIGFDGVVSSDNGLLYFVPSSSTQVVEFDPVTKGVTYIGSTYSISANKWAGGCIAPNGKIYCAPHDNSNILEIDPVTKITRLINTSSTAAFGKWKGAVLSPDGKIFFMPYNATEVLIYDYLTDSVSYITGLAADSNKYVGGALGFNGKIYAAAHAVGNVLEIDPLTLSVANYVIPATAGTNKYFGMVSDVDGIMYGMPSNADGKMLVVDGIEGNYQWQISAYSNKY